VAVKAPMRPRPLPSASPAGDLEDALERLLSLLPGADADEADSAWERVLAMHGIAENEDPANPAVLAFLADMLVAHAAEQPWSGDEISEVLEETAAAANMPRDLAATTVYLRAVRDPRLLELSPPLAVAAQLGLFLMLAPVTAVSLWTSGPLESPRSVFHAGETALTRRARLVARQTLSLNEPDETDTSRGVLLGVPVLCWQRPHAALVVRAKRNSRELARILAEDAAAALAPVLEREALLARSSSRERSLVEASERRLARLGFDLHDGPMQTIVSLAGDIRLLRQEMADAGFESAPMLQRLDRLEACLGAVDSELRQLVHSLEPSSLKLGSLRDLLARELESFRTQTEMSVDLNASGDLEGLTASQRIALVRIVQEALNNIREHSGASRVSVSVGVRRNHVWAEIEDNGHGFEVERTLVRAARNGRLGLVGMGERARLLGGRFDVVSRRGGPTAVSVVFPPWRPIAAESGPAVANSFDVSG
jgi:signal transduction histidine kinase